MADALLDESLAEMGLHDDDDDDDGDVDGDIDGTDIDAGMVRARARAVRGSGACVDNVSDAPFDSAQTQLHQALQSDRSVAGSACVAESQAQSHRSPRAFCDATSHLPNVSQHERGDAADADDADGGSACWDQPRIRSAASGAVQAFSAAPPPTFCPHPPRGWLTSGSRCPRPPRRNSPNRERRSRMCWRSVSANARRPRQRSMLCPTETTMNRQMTKTSTPKREACQTRKCCN